MSTGNPKDHGFTLIQGGKKTPEQPTESLGEIPLSFFSAFIDKKGFVGEKDVIVAISFSREFYKKIGVSDPSSYHFQKGDSERIERITGFSLEELSRKQLELADEYINKKTCPLVMEDLKM